MGGAEARERCSAMPCSKCAALDGQVRPIPRKCLRIRAQKGASMQIRRCTTLSGTRAGLVMVEGERLFREFVQRHGLYSAMWAIATPNLALAPEGSTQSTRTSGDSTSLPPAYFRSAGENMFSVLHSIQRIVVEREHIIATKK